MRVGIASATTSIRISRTDSVITTRAHAAGADLAGRASATRDSAGRVP